MLDMGIVDVWKAILGEGWLALGNAWRNLFLLSCIAQAGALGTAFAIHKWFSKRSRVASFLTGVVITPLAQYLWMLLMAYVWPKAPNLVYIGIPPALACLYLLNIAIRNFRRVPALAKQGRAFFLRAIRFDKAALIPLCFALALSVILLPVCVRLSISTNAVGSGDSGEYMGLAVRYCDDRDIGKLLEKEETVGHFRGHSHFPSLELYMSYGLMHTSGDYGYPNDKPLITGVGLLTFYMIAAYLALLTVLTRERKRWVLLGVLLLNLVPNLYYSVNGAPRDIWRILALVIAALFFAELTGLRGLRPSYENGKGNHEEFYGGLRPFSHKNLLIYIGKLLASFAICFTVMSAHVVCFVVLPFIVMAWVFYNWYNDAVDSAKKAWKELFAGIGIAISGALGTLVAFSGNLWCWLKWGEMSPWRLMTTYTSAPWYEMYMLKEYKLEASHTQLNFWKARYDIVLAYATPIGIWGMRLALIGLVCGLGYLIWRKRRQKRLTAEGDSLPVTEAGGQAAKSITLATLFTLFTLAPMTGLLDTGFYSFSGAFTALQRYTLQWYLFAAAMICAIFAALESVWPKISALILRCYRDAECRLRVCRVRLCRVLWIKFEIWLRTAWVRRAWKCLPALLCVALSLAAFVQGTNQTGYANSFYRYSRNVIEDEALLLDTSFLQRYGLLMTAARHVPETEKILLTRAGYQYPIRARGYVLTANPIVPLMNLSLEEVPVALREMGVCMLATEPKFWDERYYADSTLSDYLNSLPPDQILQDGDMMRLYILDPEAARAVVNEIEQHQGVSPP